MRIHILSAFLTITVASAALGESLDSYVGSPTDRFIKDATVAANITNLLADKPRLYFNGREEQSPEAAFREWIAVPDTVEKVEPNYFFATGCRPDSCKEKAFIATEANGTIQMLGIVHHYPQGREFVTSPVVQTYSTKALLDDVAPEIKARVEAWKKEVLGNGKKKFRGNKKRFQIWSK